MDKESHEEKNNHTTSGDPLAIRKRGRPVQNTHTTSADSMAKRKRGRPEQNNHTTSSDFMAIRKRGRPKKHFNLDDPNNQSPPGFSRTQHQSLQNEAMVGQHVSGVIEATFEDGFLLSVKVGDSGSSMLRGVVFKPGHFTPVSVDNDIAPHVPMIRRRNSDKSRLHEKRGARALVPVPIQPKHPTITDHLMAPLVHMQSQVSGASNGKPLFTQVMEEKGQVHTEFTEAESEEQALSIEPLQAIHPLHPVHMRSYGRGNMTELLQAVQENVRETHFSQGQ